MSGRSCVCGEQAVARASHIRVLVVDDHPAVRASLTDLLAEEADLLVVGECEDGADVVEAADRLRPDVVLMDLSMPRMDGVAATHALRVARMDPRVVVLTGEDVAARADVEAAGADAFLPKSTRADALLACLRAVVAGCDCCPYCL